MKTKLNKIKSILFKSTLIIRNISRNVTKDFLNNPKVKKTRRFIKNNRFYFIIITIILLFIFKNIYTIYSYNKEIELHNDEIVRKKALNNQLKEDLDYYKTDTYIIKIATEELNLRLTKENRLYHEQIFSYTPPIEEANNTQSDSNSTESEEQEIEDNVTDTEENNNEQ